jgi:hypothetical protein
MATQVAALGKSFPGALPALAFGPAPRYPERLRLRAIPLLRPRPRPWSAGTAEQLAAQHNPLVLSMLPPDSLRGSSFCRSSAPSHCYMEMRACRF